MAIQRTSDFVCGITMHLATLFVLLASMAFAVVEFLPKEERELLEDFLGNFMVLSTIGMLMLSVYMWLHQSRKEARVPLLFEQWQRQQRQQQQQPQHEQQQQQMLPQQRRQQQQFEARLPLLFEQWQQQQQQQQFER